jgi:hypothetical protein
VGLRIDQLTPEIIRGMSQEDQAKFGPGIHLPDEYRPPMKTDKLERNEQRQFANWCLLKGYAIIWHSTAHRSKATPGAPDFALTVNSKPLAIEFKRDYSCKLSKDQEEWRALHERNGGIYRVVYSAHEAIAVTESFKGVQVELIL